MATFYLNPQEFSTLAAGACTPHNRWVDGRPAGQAADEKTGLPLWKIGVLLSHEGKVTEEQVVVPAADMPAFEPFTKLIFTRPAITPRTFGDAGYTFKADAVRAAEVKEGQRNG